MAWYDISDMPWLARDPIERVTEAGVRGAQVGSMIAQTGQRNRQLNLQEKELQQRQAGEALRAKVQQQQITLNSLNIDSAIRERDDLVGNQAALSVLSSYVGGQLKSANPDYQLMRAGALDIMAINPKLFRDKRAMDLLDQVKTAEDLKNQANRIRAYEANLEGRVTASETRNDILRDQIVSRDAIAANANVTRENIAAGSNATRKDIAGDNRDAELTRLKARLQSVEGEGEKNREAAMERELLRVQNRINPQTGKALSRPQFITRHLNTMISNGLAQDEKEAASKLGKLFDDEKMGAPSSGSTSGGLPVISNKAQMEKLPSGTKFIGPDGKEWVRP